MYLLKEFRLFQLRPNFHGRNIMKLYDNSEDWQEKVLTILKRQKKKATSFLFCAMELYSLKILSTRAVATLFSWFKLFWQEL